MPVERGVDDRSWCQPSLEVTNSGVSWSIPIIRAGADGTNEPPIHIALGRPGLEAAERSEVAARQANSDYIADKDDARCYDTTCGGSGAHRWLSWAPASA